MQCVQLITIDKGVHVPCGKCEFCLQNKRKDWFFRIMQEYKICQSADFITLTYEENPIHLNKKDIQDFKKRLRKANLKYFLKKNPLIKTNKDAQKLIAKLRYFTVGEYGTQTLRPHYHSIMFNLELEVKQNLKDIWKHGHIHFGEVNEATINYTCKYLINKVDDYGDLTKPFQLQSQGLGKNYLTNGTDKYHRTNDSTTVRNRDGTRQRLPRYFKDKIFGRIQKERIASQQRRTAFEKAREERQRVASLGNNPDLYKIQQTEVLRKKIQKDSKTNNKI